MNTPNPSEAREIASVPREAIELLERAEEFCVEIFKGSKHGQHNAAVLRNRIDVYLQHARNEAILTRHTSSATSEAVCTCPQFGCRVHTYAGASPHPIERQAGEFVSVPTQEGYVTSSIRVCGRVVEIRKGQWDNSQQDWRAVLVFDTGTVVNSAYWFSTADKAMLAAAPAQLENTK